MNDQTKEPQTSNFITNRSTNEDDVLGKKGAEYPNSVPQLLIIRPNQQIRSLRQASNLVDHVVEVGWEWLWVTRSGGLVMHKVN